MATGSAPIIRHVSRRELAQNRYVWLATGGMYVAFALIAIAVVLFVGEVSPLRLQVLTGILVVLAILHLSIEPPAMDTIGNHLVIASAWLVTDVSLWAFQPGGGIALGGMIFVGPLAAVRLQDRRQIAGHLVAANASALLIGLFAGVDQATQLAIVLMLPATCVLAYSCTVVLEGAEAQGDELERLVRRDPLTGVGNRRLLEERLVDEIRRHDRTQRPLSLIALDLDGFKAVNDDLGHAAGDELLRDVATALERVAENRDTVVRQGGDEFCLILPETSAAHAVRTGNAIRAELAKIPVTSGLGIVSYPVDATDGQTLLHVGDERLRESKRAAREAGATTAPSAGDPSRPAVADAPDPPRAGPGSGEPPTPGRMVR